MKRAIPIFFVVGRERSGTTLLQMMLDQHSQVAVPTESPFIRFLYPKYKEKEIDEHTIDAFIEDLFSEPYIQLWKLDKTEVRKKLLQNNDRSFAGACKSILLSSSASDGKSEVQLLGDKNPQYSLFIPELSKLFPESKFIFISRDPRDQVLSMMNIGFEKNDPVSLAYRWSYFNRTILKSMEAIPDRVLHLRYEDLILSPEISLKKVCGFLSIAFESSMLNPEKRAKDYLEKGMLVKKHHVSVSNSIDTKKIGSWRKGMDDETAQEVEAVAEKEMINLGYDLTCSPLPYTKFVMLWPSLIYGRLYFDYLKLVNLLPVKLKVAIWKRVGGKAFKSN